MWRSFSEQETGITLSVRTDTSESIYHRTHEKLHQATYFTHGCTVDYYIMWMPAPSSVNESTQLNASVYVYVYVYV